MASAIKLFLIYNNCSIVESGESSKEKYILFEYVVVVYILSLSPLVFWLINMIISDKLTLPAAQ